MSLNNFSNHTRVGSIYSVLDRVAIDIANKGLGVDPMLAPTYQDICSVRDEMGKALDVAGTRSELQKLAEDRALKYKALHLYLESACLNPDTAKSEAANILYNHIRDLGRNLLEGSYNQQSQKASVAASYLNSDKYLPQREILTDSQAFLDAFILSNDTFIEGQLKFENNFSQEHSDATATELKKKALDLLNDELLNFLRFASVRFPDVYGELALAVDQISIDNNEIVKRAKTLRENNKDNDPGQENEDKSPETDK